MRRLSRGPAFGPVIIVACARHGTGRCRVLDGRAVCPYVSLHRSAAPAASAPFDRRADPATLGATLEPVRFYVDGTLFKTDDDGPPYAVEWMDENPFERRELAVEVDDSDGHKGRDKVVLEAFEMTEISEVASVLLEAGVYDRKGRFVERPDAAELRRQGGRRARRRSTSCSHSACRRRSRCSSTAARACRGASTSCGTRPRG